ncbi:hypothetical protein BKG94_04460 [Rodentibacter ratti]|uniref:hypothetical protein n=1 Tax=Rodentibacter ratti TaxID=1906745 RepID=UPI000984417D|nr:hypothetical protein [Rodentibacter ratti]OOF88836.1 hypothetical protein BKG94_04460 [Rodentibacter ratti]
MSKKQSNKQRIQNLLEKLQELLTDVNWSKKELANKVIEERPGYLNDTEEETEKNKSKEYEKIKKMFNRPPKKSEMIERYISFIVGLDENKERDFRKLPKLEKFDENQKAILEGIAEISRTFFANNKK